MKASLFFGAIVAVLLTNTFAYSQAKVADADDVSTIIERSEKAYHQLSMYLDSGKVISAVDRSGRVTKSAKYFRTAFATNGDFNFDFYEPGKSNSLYTVNRSFNIVRSWWGLNNKLVDPAPSLRSALQGAVVVSASASTLISAILLTNDFDYKVTFFHTLGRSELDGNEIVNGVACYKIKSVSRTGKKCTTWVAKTDYLIRKIETETMVYPAQTAAFMKKIDSVVMISANKKNISQAKSDSLRQLSERLMKDAAMMQKSSEGDKAGAFNVKETYLFFPYTLSHFNAVLFKFRPNREVEL